MESHLLRAIAVLQRDLSREEERLKAEAVATAAAKAPPVASSSMHTVSTPPASPPQSTKAMEVSTETSSTTNQTPKPSGLVSARRQSTISLSSLQRPPFPHKLDLSSSTLRMNPDEIVPSGLSSPVTLAPRSARTALPPDLVMAALNDAAGRPVDIDLTAGDTEMDMQQSGAASAVMTMDPSLGSSADKPIELDLEDIDMEFFANATEAGTDVGTDVTGGHFNSLPNNGMSNGQNPGSVNAMPKVEEDLFLNALNAVDNPGVDGDIFASLGDNSSHDRLSSSDSGSQRNPHFSSNLRKHSPGAAPSPASILASLGPSSNLAGPSLNSSGEAPFDLHNIDLSNLSHPNPGFFGDHPAEPEISIAEMESFFNMTDAGESNKESRAS
ncbi:hypothetical protein AcW1_000226 [Taiwanofungus camphoratus]|nr:hypothetical protein AcW2_001280 [Antrodia cinnamomea]KAI0935804.1 hypothetical protein AcV5_004124 [Antrodia cinnamomea]KAI0963024.1 hypothetical protein AcW1_000226 [Antrodia cinnamomea]